ncbi:MAG: hypothetical protein V7707_12000 [Motiliproteus sp.]
MEMDRYDKSEIQEGLERIETLLSTDIFGPHNHSHPLVRSAFIDLMICLDDLMFKAEKYDQRVDFVDDVLNTTELHVAKAKQVADVTDLINFFRHALCHLNEANRIHGGFEKKDHGKGVKPRGALIFLNRTFGEGGAFQGVPSKYDDDQSFAIGEHIIYLKRHIERAYTEARKSLLAKYPMINAADYYAPISRSRNMIEKSHVVKQMVEDTPYHRALEKLNNKLNEK